MTYTIVDEQLADTVYSAPFDPETAPLPSPAEWYLRLPLVRHVRWYFVAGKIDQHYAVYSSFGMLPFNRLYDERCLEAIWEGTI